MIIKYTNFSDGIHQFELTETAKKLKLEEPFFGNVQINCKMDKSPHQIVLDCDLLLHAKMICDRCAQEFESDLRSHFQISYLFSKESQKNDDYNFKFLSMVQDKIDIADDVFEYAELSVPMKRLCRADCKGLCTNCGTNLNEKKCSCKPEIVHDVWEPLKKLKDKLNN